MRDFVGASNARFQQVGQRLTKTCDNAIEQATWLRMAAVLPLEPGLRCVGVHAATATDYTMEHVTGHLATVEPGTHVTRTLYAQVERWRRIPTTTQATWGSYLVRLEAHCRLARSDVLWAALDVVKGEPPPPPSFNHGDLTYENVLIQSDTTYCLIDPNYSPSLYQSYALDYGKMLQSTHTAYHATFNSNVGADLATCDATLVHLLRAGGHYRYSLVACVTHVIRLAKYRQNEIHKVEALAKPLLEELTCTSSSRP